MALRSGLYDEKMIPFPSSLMSTSRSPSASPEKFAQHLENWMPSANREGAGAKRYGVYKKGVGVSGGLTIYDLLFYRNAAGVNEVLGVMSDGSVKRHTVAAWVDLAPAGTLATDSAIRTEVMNGKLLIADGVHNLQAYDGATVYIIRQYVTDTGTPVTKVSNSSFSIGAAGFGTVNYPVGRSVRLTTPSGTVISTVASTSLDAGTNILTVTLAAPVITAASVSLAEFQVPAPVLSDIFKFNRYLFGLSAGKPHPQNLRNAGNEGMTVYQTYRPNNETQWVADTTLSYAFTNMAGTHNTADEFLKIARLDQAIVFFGRFGLQIWVGTDPNTAGAFTWQKTIPVGVLSGSLVQAFPGDVLFYTPYGGRSLSRVFVTEQLEVGSDTGGEIDPTITHAAQTLLSSTAEYLKAYSWTYQRDGMYGFRVETKPLLYFVASKSSGWMFYSGIFSQAQVVRGGQDQILYLAVGNQLYIYANGADPLFPVVGYSDAGEDVEAIWWAMWFRFRQRWSNLYWQLMMEEAGEGTSATLTRYLDSDEGVGTDIIFSGLDVAYPYWDVAYWDIDSWGISTKEPIERDKFLCNSFSPVLRVKHGLAFETLGIKAIGK